MLGIKGFNLQLNSKTLINYNGTKEMEIDKRIIYLRKIFVLQKSCAMALFAMFALMGNDACANDGRLPKRLPIYSFGFPDDDSCASWVSERESRESKHWEGWIFGFVTGANAFGEGPGTLGSNTKAAGMLAWVDQYCTSHPLDSVTQAGFALVKALRERRKH